MAGASGKFCARTLAGRARSDGRSEFATLLERVDIDADGRAVLARGEQSRKATVLLLLATYCILLLTCRRSTDGGSTCGVLGARLGLGGEAVAPGQQGPGQGVGMGAWSGRGLVRGTVRFDELAAALDAPQAGQCVPSVSSNTA